MTLNLSANPPSHFPETILRDIDSNDSSGSWWVARTRNRHEKALAWQLLAKRISYYLPLTPKPQKSAKRTRLSLLPLFPGYLFLFFNERQRRTVLETNRVVQLIEVPRPDVLVCQLKKIQQVIDTEKCLELTDVLSKGRRVHVAYGPMKGLVGTVIKKRNGHKLEIAVDAIGLAIRVNITADMLEPVPASL